MIFPFDRKWLTTHHCVRVNLPMSNRVRASSQEGSKAWIIWKLNLHTNLSGLYLINCLGWLVLTCRYRLNPTVWITHCWLLWNRMEKSPILLTKWQLVSKPFGIELTWMSRPFVGQNLKMCHYGRWYGHYRETIWCLRMILLSMVPRPFNYEKFEETVRNFKGVFIHISSCLKNWVKRTETLEDFFLDI